MSLRRATPLEAKIVTKMVEDRIKWMDEKGLKSWNVNGYAEKYPISYFEKCAEDRTLYFATDDRNRIVCAGVLVEEDPKWDKQREVGFDAPALYIQNLVAIVGSKRAGEIFVEGAEDVARAKKISALRLNVEDNKSLSRYFRSLSFVAVGEYEDEENSLVLRQREILEPFKPR